MTRRESFSPSRSFVLDLPSGSPLQPIGRDKQFDQSTPRPNPRIPRPPNIHSPTSLILDGSPCTTESVTLPSANCGFPQGCLNVNQQKIGASQGRIKKDFLDASMPIISFPKLSVPDRNANLNGKQLAFQSLKVEASEVSKEQKTVRIESTNFDAAIQKVTDTIAKEKEANFAGVIVFNIRGALPTAELEKYTTKIKEIISENGYLAKSKPNHPNMVFFRMMKLTQKQYTERRMAVRLSTISVEKATSIVRMQLKLNFPGIIEFVPETGRYNDMFMGNFPEKIAAICRTSGYCARLCEHQVVECWRDLTSKPDSEELLRTVVQLPSFDPETAENLIKKQLESSFRGYVLFEAEKGFFSRSQMRNYPQRIIDLCEDYGYRARVVDEIKNSVECEQFGTPELPEVVFLSPNDVNEALNVAEKYLDKKRRMEFKPLYGKFSKVVEGAITDAVRVSGVRCVFANEDSIRCNVSLDKSPQKIIVEISSFDKVVAEALVRTHLESNYHGKIVFKPAHSRYSPTAMPEYPDRIVMICSEYGFDAKITERQCVTCSKTSKRKTRKNVTIVSDDSAEDAVVAEIVSGEKGIVVFSPESKETSEKVMKICRKYGFTAKLASPDLNFDVQCNISPSIINITDLKSAEGIVTNHLRPNSESVCVFRAGDPQIKDAVSSVCKECGYTPIDAGNVFVVCSSRPTTPTKGSSKMLVISLPTYDAETAESLIRTQLECNFTGIVRFSPKSYKYSESMMPGWPGRILEIIDEFGFKGKLIDTVSQIVECEMFCT